MSIPNTAHSNVFVYGTLKREMFNHKILAEGVNSGKFIGVGETSKAFKFSLLLSSYGFPYLIQNEEGDVSSSNTAVRGEVYTVNEEKLAELDILENIASGLYKRSVIEVELLTDENDEKIPVEQGEEKNILLAFAYIAGDQEDKSDLPRMEEYTKEIHDEKYVPKGSRPGFW